MDLYDKVFDIWMESSDKESVEKTFEILTGGMKLESIFKTLIYIRQSMNGIFYRRKFDLKI